MTVEDPVHTAEYVRVEFGRRLDCAAQGCDPLHADNGEVVPWIGQNVPDTSDSPTVSNHAAVWVERTVTYSPWTHTDGSGAPDA